MDLLERIMWTLMVIVWTWVAWRSGTWRSGTLNRPSSTMTRGSQTVGAPSTNNEPSSPTDKTTRGLSPPSIQRGLSSPRHPHETGRIRMYLGAMGAGKTDRLRIEFFKKQHSASKLAQRCLLIKYAGDTRFSSDKQQLTSRSGASAPVEFAVQTLDQVPKASIDAVQYIFVDEGQFFPSLCEHSRQWALAGKEVFISALDTDANQNLWPVIARLMAISIYEKLESCCDQCGGPATMTFTHDAFHPTVIGGAISAISAGASTNESKQAKIRIGDKDIYTVRCPFHTPTVDGRDMNSK